MREGKEKVERWKRKKRGIPPEGRANVPHLGGRAKESERGNPSGFCLLRRLSELYRHGASSSHGGSLVKDAPGLSRTSTTSDSVESNGLDTEIPAVARRPRSTRGSQKWSNVRAVMALYSSLRKIKRYSRHCSIWTVTSELHSHLHSTHHYTRTRAQEYAAKTRVNCDTEHAALFFPFSYFLQVYPLSLLSACTSHATYTQLIRF